MPVSRICLDVDGVLADFIKAAIRVHGLDEEFVRRQWNLYRDPRPWDMAEVIGCSTNAFWKPIHKAGEAFWEDLELLDHAKELYAACSDIAPTILLTSPSQHRSSHSGKSAWIQKHFGRSFRDYSISPRKDFCASPGVVLIDDSPEGCKLFAKGKNGGWPILFPSIGNEKHDIQGSDILKHVISELHERMSWP
jgi:5'(3')-deoxyribonucleotidase